MRLYTFEHENQFRLGAQWKTQLVDLGAAYRIFLERKPPETAAVLKRVPVDLSTFLQLGLPAFEAAREALAFASRRPAVPVDERLVYSFDEIKPRAPLPHRGKIVCATGASNHWFVKLPSTVIGTSDPIIGRSEINQLQSEARLGVVIGKRSRMTPEAGAMSCVAGFTILNDISSQDGAFPQQNFLSKNADTFCPMGPCMATFDELPKLIGWKTSLNGALVQSGSMGEIIASIPRSLHELSNTMTLEPGDIIGIALSPGFAIDLNARDISVIEIDGIGTLENRVDDLASSSDARGRDSGKTV